MDAEQPVFVLASVHLADDVAIGLLGNNDKELKFAKSKKNSRGRKQILDILDSPALSSEKILISGVHKPFMIITKMLDLLVEPFMHATGFDFYAKGLNICMANMWYFAMPVFIGKERFEALKVAFVKMVRTPSAEKIDQFYSIVANAIKHINYPEFADDLKMLLATRVIAESDFKGWNSSDLDPAIPLFCEHAAIWTGTFNTEFLIVHDESKTLSQEQIILEAMMSTKEKTVIIGYDRRKKVFPIRANSINFCNSSECPQVQVADIVAGATVYSLCQAFHKDSDSFAKEILSTRIFGGSFYPLWPELKFTPEELGTNAVGGIDANDYVGGYIAHRLGGIPPKGKREKR